MGHSCTGHNYIVHDHMGHNLQLVRKHESLLGDRGHNYVGHNYTGQNYTVHDYIWAITYSPCANMRAFSVTVVPSVAWLSATALKSDDHVLA